MEETMYEEIRRTSELLESRLGKVLKNKSFDLESLG